MEENEVKLRDIPEEEPFNLPENARHSKRYIEVKGFAWFGCRKKHHRWPSSHSWCFIDLKKQRICYRYKQKCKKCESYTAPEFTEESIERMVKFVLKKYLIKMKKLPSVFTPRSADTDQTQGGPHDERRCGKCMRLGRSCWK